MVPASVRLAVRRWMARRTVEHIQDVWPILPGSERPPESWAGWPDGKQFAFVLTHDVEGAFGLSKCRRLMELEQRLGFRSSFNFIPEGSYEVPSGLREELTDQGFEVGVHDLHHNGNLYSSRRRFLRDAERINHYLKEWGAVGFRSGFMFHNLEWAHELNVLYEASTFDTDPFEPQPDGLGTIFPLWVPHPGTGGGRGYVELPYTLAQDHTLFLLLSHREPDIWLRKLDWVAQHGGMALIDAHPDHMALNGNKDGVWEYPVALYTRLLDYVRTQYAGKYWHVTARELAQWYKGTLTAGEVKVRSAAPVRVESPVELSASRPLESKPARTTPARPGNGKPKIWIDLDNTPHVPFFEPIIEELEARGFPLLVTAREAFQVCELADAKGLRYIKVGRHHGKHLLAKGAGLIYRALQLAPLVMRERPAFGVSHGARSQILLAKWLRIPTLLLTDYEGSRFPAGMSPTYVMMPESVIDSATHVRSNHALRYHGIKEDAYAWKLKVDPAILAELDLGRSDLVVTVRPPATEAHYHNPESERLFEAFMERALHTPGVKIVLLPRNTRQLEAIRGRRPDWFRNGQVVVPGRALDGLNLIWHSDLVVSGGGTMNREAAALGVPVYSIFRGTIGGVDKHLSATGRLVLIQSAEDVANRIKLVKRAPRSVTETTSKRTLTEIVDKIQELAMDARDQAPGPADLHRPSTHER